MIFETLNSLCSWFHPTHISVIVSGDGEGGLCRIIEEREERVGRGKEYVVVSIVCANV